jgi:hypothetical protein
MAPLGDTVREVKSESGLTERDANTVLFIAKSTEAVTLCGTLAALTEKYEEEKDKAHERFQTESDLINDRYCGRVQRAYREYSNRVTLLAESSDSDFEEDDD